MGRKTPARMHSLLISQDSRISHPPSHSVITKCQWTVASWVSTLAANSGLPAVLGAFTFLPQFLANRQCCPLLGKWNQSQYVARPPAVFLPTAKIATIKMCGLIYSVGRPAHGWDQIHLPTTGGPFATPWSLLALLLLLPVDITLLSGWTNKDRSKEKDKLFAFNFSSGWLAWPLLWVQIGPTGRGQS